MIITSKMKVYVFILGILLAVGQAFAVWDGSIATTAPETETGADGKTYYLIDSEAKLAWFAEQVNGGQWSYNAKLIANLDMSNPDPSKKSLWTPIAVGNGSGGSKVFKGTFDGNKHVISNLYISAEELITKYYGQPINNNNGQENGTAQNLGFIGCLTGTVKNLIIENIEVHGYGKGGLGENKNLVDKPLSIGTVVGWQSTDASVIEGCYVTGVVITSGDGQAVGGIVGNVGSGTVRNCYSAVDVYASGLAYVGGIAGYTKKYSGNLVTMESCVYAGETLSTEGSAQVAGKDSSGRAGAIIGYQYKGTVTLSNLYYDQEQFPGENAGIGATTGGSTTGSTTAQPNVNSAETICLLNKGTFTDGVCNKNSPWEMGESGPVLNEYSADGFKIAFDANGGSFAGNTASAVKYVKQGVVINDDGLAKPSRDDFAFVGWSVNNEATEPDQNLGTASGAATFYAVWNPVYTITFKATPRTFPAEVGQTPETEKTVKVEKDKKIAVHGFEVPEPYHDNEGKKHSFMGWAFQENPSEADALVDENGLDNLPYATKDTTLYAVWVDATVFTVTFDANGHGTTVSRYQKTVYEQDNVSPLAEESMPHEDGYVLNSEHGWCVKPECGENDFFDFSTPISGNITLYANWDAIEYDVSYENLNGASNPNPAKYTAAGLTLEDLVSVDGARVFKGWCIDAGLTNCITELKVGSVGDTILYAKWEDVTYPIIYRAAGSGATGNVSQGVKYHGVPYTLLGESYNRPGYKQNGWTTSLTGEKLLDFGDSYTDNASITFYPTWEIATYTITYVCDGCTDVNNPTSYTMFEETDLTLSNPTYPGPNQYIWKKWFTDAEFTKEIKKITKGSYGDITIYGKLLKYYNLTYVLNGSTKANNPVRYHVESATFALNDPAPRDGYTFAGWYDNEGLAGEPVTEIPLGSTGDKTFYAKWIPETYTITYVIDGVENAIDPETYTIEDAVTLAAPTRDGYEFDGWYTNAEFNGNKVTSIVAGTIGDTTFFAKWTPVEYSITYVLEEGASNDNDNPASYTVETEAITLKDALKNGYTFEGWFNGEGEKVTTVAGGATGNLELTAQFTIETYTITYHNIEGASFETSNPATYTVDDLPFTLKNPTKDGYTFEGWFIDESFTGNPITGIETRLSNGNGDLYAKWSDPIEYSITYVIDGESTLLTPDEFTVVDNVTLAVPGMDDGYIFDGWYLDEEMTGEKVTSFEAGTYAANQTFYGKTIRSYTITYVDADGLENSNPTSYTVLENDLVLQPVSKSGFKFLGWFNASDELVESISAGSTGDITLTAKWAEFPITVATYGGVTILENEDGTRTAAIDASSMETVEITEDVSVDNVTFDRAFTVGATSTIMLPFSIATSKVSGGKFYEFADLQKNEETGRWAASVKPPEQSELQANKPYLFIPEETSIVFNLGGEPVSLNTSVMNPSTSGNWSFKGVYEKTVFTEEHPELGKAYGFAAENKDGFKLGQFVKFGSGAWLRPFRAYLAYNESGALAKSTRSVRASLVNGELPETIDVEIQDGTTRVIGGGTLNTRTGEIKMDRWYDMNGRRLNSKPTTRGTYYYNGKRIVVR